MHSVDGDKKVDAWIWREIFESTPGLDASEIPSPEVMRRLEDQYGVSKADAGYKLYYFEGRNTGIAARSAEEARRKKKRGGDKIVSVRTPNEEERKAMRSGQWVRTRSDGKGPAESSRGKGRGQGPPRMSKAGFDPSQARDKNGRWTDRGVSGFVTQKQARMLANLGRGGGFTWNDEGRELATTGKAVSPYKDKETVFEPDEFTAQAIREFAKKHKDALTGEQAMIGAWVEDGKVWLDVSIVVDTNERAEQIAAQADQLAYFDLETFETYYRQEDGSYTTEEP